MRIVLTLVPFNYQNIQSHYEAILTAWFRAESLPVEYWLLKCKIRYSPTCSFCSADDGSEVHYLFYCRAWANERDYLFQIMQFDSEYATWADFWHGLSKDYIFYRLFVRLFLQSGRF